MSKSLVISLLLLPLAGAVQPALAQIYKTTDEAGNVVYTDKPPPNTSTSETVELRQLNTTPAPTAIPALAPSSPAAKEQDAPKAATATIISPAQDTTIPMGPGNFSVSAELSSGLGLGQSLQLLIDGQPSGDPQRNGSWSLTNVFRGTHNLVVTVIDAKGKTLSSSEPVQMHVMRPSVNSPH